MRIIVETMTGRVYRGADTPSIMMKETLLANADEEPKEITDPAEVASLICKWTEDLTNALSPFSLMGSNGEIYIIQPEVLKRSVITVEPSGNAPVKRAMVDFDKLGEGVTAHPAQHDAPGVGGGEEPGNAD